MKELFIISLLLFVTVVGCNSDECTIDKTEEPLCETEYLNITEINRYAFIVYNNETDLQIIDEYSHRWKWNIENDTIEISARENEYLSHHFFFKKIDNQCPTFLFYRFVEFDDAGVVFDSETGELIESGYFIQDYSDSTFKIQDYIENEVLIGDIDYLSFWMEFTEDNHRIVPYNYEQYF